MTDDPSASQDAGPGTVRSNTSSSPSGSIATIRSQNRSLVGLLHEDAVLEDLPVFRQQWSVKERTGSARCRRTRCPAGRAHLPRPRCPRSRHRRLHAREVLARVACPRWCWRRPRRWPRGKVARPAATRGPNAPTTSRNRTLVRDPRRSTKMRRAGSPRLMGSIHPRHDAEPEEQRRHVRGQPLRCSWCRSPLCPPLPVDRACVDRPVRRPQVAQQLSRPACWTDGTPPRARASRASAGRRRPARAARR